MQTLSRQWMLLVGWAIFWFAAVLAVAAQAGEDVSVPSMAGLAPNFPSIAMDGEPLYTPASDGGFSYGTPATFEARPENGYGSIDTGYADPPDLEDPRIRALVQQYVSEELAKTKAEEEAKKAAGHEVGSELGMSATWNNGVELSTKSKDFRLHVGGRTQMDTGWFSVDPNVNNNINTPYSDGMDFRRARLRIDGTMYEIIDWAAEYDFVNAARVRNAADTGTSDVTVTAPTDLWIQFKELPVVGNVRVGNQKEPIGFEHQVSSRFLPFMERSYNQDSFYGGSFNGFTPGIQFFDTYDEEMGVWQVGVFKPTNSVFASNNSDGDYSAVARLTRLLWYVEEGRGLLHAGIAARQATPIGTAGALGRQITFRTRDAIRTGLATNWPVPATTGSIFGDDMQWLNGELAAVYGPVTLQAEYLVSGLQDARLAALDPSLGNLTYHGGYVQMLYYLTGENDRYDLKRGAFDRVKPLENFFLVRGSDGSRCLGRGAWQVGARYNYLDLNDITSGGTAINGGILHNMTGGLNWFLNPNVKVQFNYMATYRDAPLAAGTGDGWIHGWGARVAHDF